MKIWEVILSALCAGIIGTICGAVVEILFGAKNKKLNVYLMSFAGGMMLALCVFELLPEAFEHANERLNNNVYSVLFVIAFVVFGLILVMFFSHILDKKTGHHHHVGKECNTCDDLTQKTGSNKKTALMLTIALCLHNLPEGIGLGVTATLEAPEAIILAIMIALHNIPSGIAMTSHYKDGGLSNSKTLGIVAITGIPTLVGAIIGFYIGNNNGLINSIAISIVAGLMLYIVFFEIIKEVFEEDDSKYPILVTIGSLILGFAILNLV